MARGGQVLAAQIAFSQFVGRTDLRIGASGAKFHEENDFDAEKCRFFPKSRKNDEKLISETQKNRFFSNRFFDVLVVAKGRRRLEF